MLKYHPFKESLKVKFPEAGSTLQPKSENYLVTCCL